MVVTVVEKRSPAEPAAKAELLNFLRDNNRLTRETAVSTELILDKHSVRADLALCNEHGLHCFEIKTHRDTLSRLDKQVSTYSEHADFVTVVAATRHINSVLSRVPHWVGVYELLSFSGLRVVREASISKNFSPDAMLSILPVSEMNSRLGIKARLRSEALSEARLIEAQKKKAAVMRFFKDRYLPTTRAFLSAARRRAILPKDLVHLKRWLRISAIAQGVERPSSVKHVGCPDEHMYRQVGKSFSAVPDDVRRLLLS